MFKSLIYDLYTKGGLNKKGGVAEWAAAMVLIFLIDRACDE